jgi:hypothetical protein
MPKCASENCNKETNQSFGFGDRIYFYCEDHKAELYELVTRKAPKPTPKPKS